MKKMLSLSFLLLLGLSRSVTAAENRVTPKDFIIDPPTLINLGFEWFIEGDDNRNASVEVHYRKTGTDWATAARPRVKAGDTILVHAGTYKYDRYEYTNNLAVIDFRLKPSAAAIDRGISLPNVNEGFSGRAPDLGALEAGKPVPHYGPRP